MNASPPAFGESLASAIVQHGLLWLIEPTVGLSYWESAKAQTLAHHVSQFREDPNTSQAALSAAFYVAGGNHDSHSSLNPEDLSARTPYYDGSFIGDRHELASEKPYALNTDGIAQFGIDGPMTKKLSMSAAGTSTVHLRRIVGMASRDPDVKGGLLKVDSPGGSVAGTDDLAKALQAFAAEKPLFGFAEDFTASAGYWAAACCSRIFATDTTHLGSIGTILVIPDMSKMAASAGVEVHVITSDGAKYKGAGTPGAALTAEHLAYFRQMANGMQAFFSGGVSAGRKISADQIKALAGRMFIAAEAKKLGLVDGICSYQDCYDQLVGTINGTSIHPVSGFGKQENSAKEVTMLQEDNALSPANVGIIASALATLGWGPKDQPQAAAPAMLPGTPLTAAAAQSIALAAASVGIASAQDVTAMYHQNEDGKIAKAHLVEDCKVQAIRCLGGKDGLKAMEGMTSMPAAYVVSMRDAYRSQSNAKYGVPGDGETTQRTSAGGELPEAPAKVGANAEQPDATSGDVADAASARAAGAAYARQMAGLPPA